MPQRLRLILPLAVILLFVSQALRKSDDHPDSKWYTDAYVAAWFRPLGSFFNGLSDRVSGSFNRYFLLVDVESRNRRLEEEVERLRMENTFLKEELHKWAELEHMTQTQPFDPASLLPARILSYDLFTASKTVIIDRGRQEGVKADDVVMAGSGLVGRVLHAYDFTSKVLLLIDPNFAVDVVNGRSGVRVLVSGLNEKELNTERQPFLTQVEYLENAQEMLKGDALMTSGLGHVFPRGIPVGIVDEVSYSSRNLFDTARVIPAVDFNKLTRVFVLLDRGHRNIEKRQGPQATAPRDDRGEPAANKKRRSRTPR